MGGNSSATHAGSTTARILVVEDDKSIVDAIAYRLALERFDVDVARDGESALQVVFDDYDVIVLDLMLPELSGLEVCRRVRVESIVPILILTARAAVSDRVLGLEAGADDYLTKPFANTELVGRIRAMLRRRELERSIRRPTERSVGDLRLDLSQQELRIGGRRIDLTQSEFRLLALLAEAPDRVFTRREIVEHLWRSSHVGDARTCDVHIKNLRRKIEHDPSRPERLITVRGAGYVLRS